MVSSQPHFLLFSRASSQVNQDQNCGRNREDRNEARTHVGTRGTWHFLLESMDGTTVVEESDQEPNLRGERLELLAVVRGLEALDQPSRVTLVTSSRRISRGFRYGLEEWRGNDWQWERDGRWVPIKNADLWRRVDRALKFHHVKCRTLRIDDAQPLGAPAYLSAKESPEMGSLTCATRRQGQRGPQTRPLKQRLTAAFRALFGAVDPGSSWSHSAQLSN